ncbi:hypothetical protein L3i20_v248800 [Paenibacillus sp. L3-i20]|nr:hypothetical protein L3i20_v248800 [Paenibacillus sp. L3-i20]
MIGIVRFAVELVFYDSHTGGHTILNYTNTTTEIADSGTDTVILSVGATEQFGPFLPMHLNTLIAVMP